MEQPPFEVDEKSSDPIIAPAIEAHWPPDSAKASGIAKSEKDAVNTTAPTSFRVLDVFLMVFFVAMTARSLLKLESNWTLFMADID